MTFTLRFASSLTCDDDPMKAADALIAGVRHQMAESTIDLAVLFVSSHYGREAGRLLAAVHETLAPRVLVGCSGEGVIGMGREVESGPAASLWAAGMPETTLLPLRLSFSTLQDQFAMTGWPPHVSGSQEMSSGLLLFADPFSTPMQELLPVLEDRYPGTVVIGGLAGGGRDAGENQLFLDGNLFDSGLVGVAITGGVSITAIVSQGCRPIGERYIVTKAEQNVIYELSGMPALQCLQQVYHSLNPDERELAHRALHVGLAVDEYRPRFERGDFLIRNLIGADQQTGGVVIGDVAQEGQTIQFQVRDGRTAHEDLEQALRRVSRPMSQATASRGALMFSCCGRGKGLFGRRDHDVSMVEQCLGRIPLSGFFAQGEIGPVGARSFLHGYTASIALFAHDRGVLKT